MLKNNKVRSIWYKYISTLVLIALATLIFIQGRNYFLKGQWALLYLLIIVFVASNNGVRAAVYASFVSFFTWNFFLIPPYHTLHVYDPKDWLFLFVFLVVSIIIGLQTGKLREREELARSREEDTALLNAFSAHLVSDISINELGNILNKELAEKINANIILLYIANDQGILKTTGNIHNTDPIKDSIVNLVNWSYSNSRSIGFSNDIYADLSMSDNQLVSVEHNEVNISDSSKDMAVLIQTSSKQAGVLYVGQKINNNEYDISEIKLIVAIVNQIAAFIERKQLQTIAIQADALHEADRMKSIFVSSVSHELKTPLASITATITNLLENDLNWDETVIKTEISAIKDDLNRLNESISSLVDLSRLESAAWFPNRDWYELGEILGTVMSGFPKNQLDRIQFKLPEDTIMIYVDYAQWVRVLKNLIENSLNYSYINSNIIIGASERSNDLIIWVEDNGPGIPEDEIQFIFDKFFRGAASKNITSGTGLGLSIAKEIIKSHEGDIWVENIKPNGSRFVISLPMINEGKLN